MRVDYFQLEISLRTTIKSKIFMHKIRCLSNQLCCTTKDRILYVPQKEGQELVCVTHLSECVCNSPVRVYANTYYEQYAWQTHVSSKCVQKIVCTTSKIGLENCKENLPRVLARTFRSKSSSKACSTKKRNPTLKIIS